MAEPKPHHEFPSSADSKDEDVKTPNIFERAKEEIEAVFHKDKSHEHPKHHKETHGTSEDIDENTPVDEIKGPSVVQRVREELEALVQAIHPKKDSDH
ncbi:hypothetical protein MLD38_028951 [Melastoma candidum]|uniref:Uncharacterized protein n=1 Tax=Melastoma candidum TaxID=119954 RepID=A0ACB9N6S0_9MYRT|nr:hypothetical protein MLD38_028951 [Melastoma candidum]